MDNLWMVVSYALYISEWAICIELITVVWTSKPLETSIFYCIVEQTRNCDNN